MKADLEARNLEQRGEAEKIGKKLDGQSVTVLRQAAEGGQLYGSVSTRDIAGLLSENGFAVDRTQIALNAPIKMIGLHKVPVTLHPEVAVTVTVTVARSADEATRLRARRGHHRRRASRGRCRGSARGGGSILRAGSGRGAACARASRKARPKRGERLVHSSIGGSTAGGGLRCLGQFDDRRCGRLHRRRRFRLFRGRLLLALARPPRFAAIEPAERAVFRRTAVLPLTAGLRTCPARSVRGAAVRVWASRCVSAAACGSAGKPAR